METTLNRVPIRTTLLGLGLLLTAACLGDGGPSSGPRAILARWIADDPGSACNPEALYFQSLVSAQGCTAPAFLERWKPHDIESVEIEKGALSLSGLGFDATLRYRLPFDASDFSVLEIVTERFGKGRIVARWQAAGGAGELSVDTNRATGEALRTFTFHLGREPSWTGRVSQFSLSIRAASDRPVRLHSLARYTRSVDLEFAATLAERGVRIAFDGDARPAVPALPDRPAEMHLDSLAAGSTLRMAVGIDPANRTPWTLRARAESADGLNRKIWSKTFDPLTEGGRWVPFNLPLDGLPDPPLSIVLEADQADPAAGLAWWGDPRIEVPSGEEPMNVVIIMLDTLRADRMSAYGFERPTTPFLERWAASDAVVFENVVAPAPWTLPSHVSIFTGLNAIRHGVNHHMTIPDSMDFLAEHFRNSGYTTAAITGGGILRPHYGFAQGFDRFSFWSDANSTNELAEGTRSAERYLEEHRDLPFFLFFHTYEIHYPHRKRQPFYDNLAAEIPEEKLADGRVKMLPPTIQGLVSEGNSFAYRMPGQQQWSTPLKPEQVEAVRTMYDSAIAYTDSKIQTLFRTLRRLDLKRKTLIIVTSDHGEALGEDGRAGHSFLDDYNLMVPLIIEVPGRRYAGRRVEHQVRLIDLMPTILDLTALPEVDDTDGTSLVPLMERPQAAFTDEAWSYAGSSNRGLALRTGNQHKRIVNDSAWRRVWGKLSLRNLSKDGTPGSDAASRRLAPRFFRARAMKLMQDTFAATRVTITNHSGGLFKARFTGTWNHRTRIKSPVSNGRALRWSHSQGVVVVPHGNEVQFFISHGRLGPGGFSGVFQPRLGEAVPIDLRFETGIPPRPVEYRLSGGTTFVEGDPSPEEHPKDGISITVWTTGPAQHDRTEAPLEPDTAAQLQALGYLE